MSYKLLEIIFLFFQLFIFDKLLEKQRWKRYFTPQMKE